MIFLLCRRVAFIDMNLEPQRLQIVTWETPSLGDLDGGPQVEPAVDIADECLDGFFSIAPPNLDLEK
jgi:hypothetical protein